MRKDIMFSCVLTIIAMPQAFAEPPRVTVYNDRFALIHETREVQLKKGENELRLTGVTAHIEPDSVMLEDPKGLSNLRLLEQNYEGDPLSEGLLLMKSEGEVLDFEVPLPNGEQKRVRGKLLRSGYVPHRRAWQEYGQQYAQRQSAMISYDSGAGTPIVEMDGQIMFALPGRPLFKGFSPESFLKPTLLLRTHSSVEGTRPLSLSYVTGGMRWDASYNVIVPQSGDALDILGLVTLENMSGKDFKDARIKVVAGDVSRLAPPQSESRASDVLRALGGAESAIPGVTERSFDEYHLYTLARPVTLLDREIKQVEFLRAPAVKAERSYVYNGFMLSSNHRSYQPEYFRREGSVGVEPNRKVVVMYEFQNSEKAGLGKPLPRGRVRVYRVDQDSQAEFIGESLLDHTPKDEPVRITLGRAFDIVGDRKQTDFRVDSSGRWSEEAIEIRLANHKKSAVEVRVLEPLWRWFNWEVLQKSQPYLKRDSQLIEYRVALNADEEKTITYRVRYSW